MDMVLLQILRQVEVVVIHLLLLKLYQLEVEEDQVLFQLLLLEVQEVEEVIGAQVLQEQMVLEQKEIVEEMEKMQMEQLVAVVEEQLRQEEMQLELSQLLREMEGLEHQVLFQVHQFPMQVVVVVVLYNQEIVMVQVEQAVEEMEV